MFFYLFLDAKSEYEFTIYKKFEKSAALAKIFLKSDQKLYKNIPKFSKNQQKTGQSQIFDFFECIFSKITSKYKVTVDKTFKKSIMFVKKLTQNGIKWLKQLNKRQKKS